jgi:ssDNA-binding Zn-finger/Zn-ribbon topoisomerase 1
MASQLALKIKCPACRKSLMDQQNKLDGYPSIALEAECNGNRGWLRLSPVYGSYDIESEFEIPADSIARIFCPQCHSELKSLAVCDLCKAPMVPLMLEEGGRILTCSRRGCKKHFLEFEDIDKALAAFYDTYALDRTEQTVRPAVEKTTTEEFDAKEIINNGSFLQSYCPRCQHTLIGNGSLTFKVIANDGKEGLLLLSPYLNVFTNRSTIDIPHGEQVKDLQCPHCCQSLIEKDKKCSECGSRTAKITVGAMHKLISFFICLRKGCTWHGLSDEDTKLIMIEDSREW